MSFMRKVHRKQLENAEWYNTDIEHRIGLTMQKVKALHRKLFGTGISRTVPTNRNKKSGFLSWALTYYSHLVALDEQRNAKSKRLKWYERIVKGVLRAA